MRKRLSEKREDQLILSSSLRGKGLWTNLTRVVKSYFRGLFGSPESCEIAAEVSTFALSSLGQAFLKVAAGIRGIEQKLPMTCEF